jgi:hypothetical protein
MMLGDEVGTFLRARLRALPPLTVPARERPEAIIRRKRGALP